LPPPALSGYAVTSHHQVQVIDAGMSPLGRRRVPNTIQQVRALMEWVLTLGAREVLAIDHKAVPAALLCHCATSAGLPVLYVTGLQARRAAGLTPGRAKTDRIDATVIAESGRTHAHRLPTLELSAELEATLRLLLGRDEDLRCDFNRTINRHRGLLQHPRRHR